MDGLFLILGSIWEKKRHKYRYYTVKFKPESRSTFLTAQSIIKNLGCYYYTVPIADIIKVPKRATFKETDILRLAKWQSRYRHLSPGRVIRADPRDPLTSEYMLCCALTLIHRE